uniref:Bromo domain-containing protein n=1 Tax=Caenorhabditis tropicalis TaxID=1561998 RepID=A0A1I7UWI6_9PELO
MATENNQDNPSRFGIQSPDFMSNELITVREVDQSDFEDLKWSICDLKFKYIDIPTVWNNEVEETPELKKGREQFDTVRVEMMAMNATILVAILRNIFGRENLKETIHLLIEDLREQISTLLEMPVCEWNQSEQLTVEKFWELMKNGYKGGRKNNPYSTKLRDNTDEEIERSLNAKSDCFRSFRSAYFMRVIFENIEAAWDKMKEKLMENEEDRKILTAMNKGFPTTSLNWKRVWELKIPKNDPRIPKRPFLTNVLTSVTSNFTEKDIMEKVEKLKEEWNRAIEWSKIPLGGIQEEAEIQPEQMETSSAVANAEELIAKEKRAAKRQRKADASVVGPPQKKRDLGMASSENFESPLRSSNFSVQTIVPLNSQNSPSHIPTDNSSSFHISNSSLPTPFLTPIQEISPNTSSELLQSPPMLSPITAHIPQPPVNPFGFLNISIPPPFPQNVTLPTPQNSQFTSPVTPNEDPNSSFSAFMARASAASQPNLGSQFPSPSLTISPQNTFYQTSPPNPNYPFQPLPNSFPHVSMTAQNLFQRPPIFPNPFMFNPLLLSQIPQFRNNQNHQNPFSTPASQLPVFPLLNQQPTSNRVPFPPIPQVNPQFSLQDNISIALKQLAAIQSFPKD